MSGNKKNNCLYYLSTHGWNIVYASVCVALACFVAYLVPIWKHSIGYWEYQWVFYPTLIIVLITTIIKYPNLKYNRRSMFIVGVLLGFMVSLFAYIGSSLLIPFGMERLSNTYSKMPYFFRDFLVILLVLGGWAIGGFIYMAIYFLNRTRSLTKDCGDTSPT